jgi:ankyrin repeat protein
MEEMSTQWKRLRGILGPETCKLIGWTDTKSNTERQTDYIAENQFIQYLLIRDKDEKRKLALIKKYINENERDGGKELMKKTDPAGATPLLFSLLLKQREIGKYFIEQFPERALDKYTAGYEDTGEYEGENALHLAIVNNDLAIVKKLIELDEKLLWGKAIGPFFQHPKKCYYGELPLSFAVCLGHLDIVKYLLSLNDELARKLLKAQDDCLGNTALHMAVHRNKIDMYDELVKLYEKFGVNVNDLRNHKKQSVFTYAAEVGKKETFLHLMDKRKQIIWNFGPVTCSGYPLEELDTMHGIDGRRGAIEYLTDGGEDRLELFELDRIKELISKKWESYGSWQFIYRGVTALFLVILLNFSIMLPRWDSQDPLHQAAAWHLGAAWDGPHYLHWRRSLYEWIIVGIVMYKARIEVSEIRAFGLVNHYWNAGTSIIENYTSLFSCCIIFFIVIIRLPLGEYGFPIGDSLDMKPADEDMLLAVPTMAAWLNLLWFFVTSKGTGVFVIMLLKMVQNDVMSFLLISACFVGGFSSSLYLLTPDEGNKRSVIRQIVESTAMMLGDFNLVEFYDNKDETKTNPLVATVLAIVLVIVLTIILVNMLIAKMGDTYSSLTGQAELIWQQERAKLIITLESFMVGTNREKLMELREKYSVKHGGSLCLQVEEEVDINNIVVSAKAC